MHHDAHVTFFNCCCSEGRAAKGHFLASHGTLFDAAVGTFPMLCGSKVLGQVPISRACIPKKNAMQLFNLWRLPPRNAILYGKKFFVCRHTDHLFGDRNGRRRDTERYTGIHWDTRVSRCIPVYPLTRIHRDTLGYTCICIPVYPLTRIHRDTLGYTCIVSRCISSPGKTGIHWDTRVSQCILISPCVSLDLLTTKFFYLWQTLEGSKKVFLRSLNHGRHNAGGGNRS